MIKAVPLVFALLLLGGCEQMTDPLSPREVRELALARAKWNGSSIRNEYQFEVRQSCFCPPEVTEWHTVTVRNGAVVSVKNAAGTVLPSNRWSWYRTVDQLFEQLIRTGESELEDITVQFDAEFGYPVEMNFLYSSRIADAGGATYARKLQGLSFSASASLP
ncbi:DUF6174 domain-containing protein [Gemmatimonas phototrophica]|uniref:Lipoprotein n=1 Tax=Gemmatimonas phototrophica TaxID=1379270 RepID=A0A143BN75_9BACT|nr:DUF6174 domain-containing protein [Gemmatimonas phototrophica]AMW05972.1 hypothetical protein GEMMAAP_16610 [Gemmatimonas phototrophica]